MVRGPTGLARAVKIYAVSNGLGRPRIPGVAETTSHRRLRLQITETTLKALSTSVQSQCHCVPVSALNTRRSLNQF